MLLRPYVSALCSNTKDQNPYQPLGNPGRTLRPGSDDAVATNLFDGDGTMLPLSQTVFCFVSMMSAYAAIQSTFSSETNWTVEVSKHWDVSIQDPVAGTCILLSQGPRSFPNASQRTTVYLSFFSFES